MTCGPCVPGPLSDVVRDLIDRGGGHRQSAHSNLRRELEMTVSFHCLGQDRTQQRRRPTANSVRHLPEHD